MECAGKHRGYGVHISFVRSLTLDTFKENQLMMMHLGGNKNARLYFDEHPLDPPPYCVKFDCESADQYRRILKRKTCNACNIPYEELPPWVPTRRMERMPSGPAIGGGTPICIPKKSNCLNCGCVIV